MSDNCCCDRLCSEGSKKHLKAAIQRAFSKLSKEDQLRYPVHAALGAKRASQVKNIVAKYPHANVSALIKGCSPLHYAAQFGEVEVVGLLLDRGADVNQRETKYGRTPLLIAVSSGFRIIADLLLDRGADVNCQDCVFYATPLMTAISENDNYLITRLLEKGANVHQRDLNCDTALMMVSCPTAAKLLFARGADPNIVNNFGLTPLMRAADKNNFHMARVLIDHGAEFDLINHSNLTALGIAISNDNVAMRFFLVQEQIKLRNGEDGKAIKDKLGDLFLFGKFDEAFNPVDSNSELEAQKMKETMGKDVYYQFPPPKTPCGNYYKGLHLRTLGDDGHHILQAKSCYGCERWPTKGEVFKRCSKCKLARYCSAECQRSDWKIHKNYCKDAAADETRASASKLAKAKALETEEKAKTKEAAKEAAMGLEAMTMVAVIAQEAKVVATAEEAKTANEAMMVEEAATSQEELKSSAELAMEKKKSKVCAACGRGTAEVESIKKCACKSARYCSQDCHEADWENHRAQCIKKMGRRKEKRGRREEKKRVKEEQEVASREFAFDMEAVD